MIDFLICLKMLIWVSKDASRDLTLKNYFFKTRTSFQKLTNEYKLPVWNYEIHLEELAKEGFSTGMESHLRNSLHLINYWLFAYFSTQ